MDTQFLPREQRINVPVATSGGGSASGSVYVPKTPENFTYDTDGNQTVDGRWNYTWDAEYRLIRMVANTAVRPQQRIDYGYDAKGRRVSKKVWSNTAGTGSPATYNRFIYDGWNLLAELDGNNTNAIVRSYIWGSDLSGSMQGAGGVGGLLMINDPTTVATHFVAHDGNGNVAATVSGSAGTTTATYEYGPFGEVIRSSGTISKTNPYRFSTKYQDNETDLLYYGYRYYNQSTGRWLSRDPAQEAGGFNLYAMLDNDALDFVDLVGLAPVVIPPKSPIPPDQRGCCDSKTIAQGENELNKRYKKAVQTAASQGLQPAKSGQDGASCKNSSFDILYEFLLPSPKCWKCHIEERNYYSPKDDPKDTNIDHSVISCTGYASSGSKKEIIFDWWGDTSHGDNQSGGSPDKFRKKFPYPPENGNSENQRYIGCDGKPVRPSPPGTCDFPACKLK